MLRFSQLRPLLDVTPEAGSRRCELCLITSRPASASVCLLSAKAVGSSSVCFVFSGALNESDPGPFGPVCRKTADDL